MCKAHCTAAGSPKLAQGGTHQEGQLHLLGLQHLHHTGVLPCVLGSQRAQAQHLCHGRGSPSANLARQVPAHLLARHGEVLLRSEKKRRGARV